MSYVKLTYFRFQLNENLRAQLQAASVPIGIEEEFVTDPYSSMEHLKVLMSYSKPLHFSFKPQKMNSI